MNSWDYSSYIKPDKFNMALILLCFISIMKFIVSLKEAIKYINCHNICI